MNNNIKILFLFFINLIIGNITLNAQVLSTQDAEKLAKKYFGTVKKVSETRALNDSETKNTFHIFNRENGGYVIISGEEKMPDIVGYTDKGDFDANNIPIQLKEYLKNYSKYVSNFRNNKLRSISNEPKIKPIYTVVEPLITTKWNQNYPYNIYTPKDNNRKTPSGCVATSMAQVMYYYKWPKKGKGSHSYTDQKGHNISTNFEEHTYQWDKMVSEYSFKYNQDNPDESETAVAQLMYDCGVAANMNYSVNGSGAYTNVAASGMEKYFSYKAEYIERDFYTTKDFIEIIKRNLDEGRPIIYDGAGTNGAHAWVVDGYDSNGFVHCNWGWGGLSDGFFDMNYMNPSDLGIGGGAGGFSRFQHITILTPNKDNSERISKKALTQKGTGYIRYTLNDLEMNIVATEIASLYDKQFSAEYRAVLRNLNNGDIFNSSINTYSFHNKYHYSYYNTFTLSLENKLPDAKYEISLLYRDKNNTTDNEWSEMENVNKIEFEIKNAKDSILTKNLNLISYDKHKVPQTIYYGENTELVFFLQNISKVNLERSISIYLVSTSLDRNTGKPQKEINISSVLAEIYNDVKKPISKNINLKNTNVPAGEYKLQLYVNEGFGNVLIENFNNEDIIVNVKDDDRDKSKSNLYVKNIKARFKDKSTSSNNKKLYITNKDIVNFVINLENNGFADDAPSRYCVGLKDIETGEIIIIKHSWRNAYGRKFPARKTSPLFLFGDKIFIESMEIGKQYIPVLISSYRDPSSTTMNPKYVDKVIDYSEENQVILERIDDKIPNLSLNSIRIKKSSSDNSYSDRIDASIGDKIQFELDLKNDAEKDFNSNIQVFVRAIDSHKNIFLGYLKDIVVPASTETKVFKESKLELNIPTDLEVGKEYEFKFYSELIGENKLIPLNENSKTIKLNIIPNKIDEPKAIMSYKIGDVKIYRNKNEISLNETKIGDNIEISIIASNSGNKNFNGEFTYFLFNEKGDENNKFIYIGSKKLIEIKANSFSIIKESFLIDNNSKIKNDIDYKICIMEGNMEPKIGDNLIYSDIYINFIPLTLSLNINNIAVDVKRDNKIIDPTKSNIGDYLDFSFDINNDGDLEYNNDIKILLIKNNSESSADIIEVVKLNTNIKIGKNQSITYRYQLPSNLAINSDYEVFVEYQKDGQAIRKSLNKTIHIVKKAETNSIEIIDNSELDIRLDKVSRRLMISSDLGVKLVKVYSLDGILIRVLEANSTEMEIDLSNTNSNIFIISIDNIAPFKISF